jgi:phosphatidylethanolamine/phosphatidyl-N-methylethanolamine N-methyltransferase
MSIHSSLEFIKAAIRNPLEVSTVFPTSKFLAERMLDQADIRHAKSIVELGAGTGAITQYIHPRLGEETKYLGVELDEKMVEFLRAEFPTMEFRSDFADSIANTLPEQSVDVVISSLPWTVFSEEIQDKTLDAIVKTIKPGGVFLTYVCANAMVYPRARSLIRKLHTRFRDVQRSPLEWRNVPPAFVYRSIR